MGIKQKWLGWHFSTLEKKLGYDDGRPIKAGITHSVDCEPQLCEVGLHAAKFVLDAARYAPGAYLWRVQLDGDIVHGDDKSCATKRKYLYGFNAEKMLQLFARQCALDVIHLWNAPDIVKKYLESGDEALRMGARNAALGAAHAAAHATAYATYATAYAAYTAAKTADAAHADAIIKKQKERLEKMATAEIRKIQLRKKANDAR